MAEESYREVRDQTVAAKVCSLWTTWKRNCTCLGEPAVRPSQGEEDQNCPYCLCDEEGGDVERVAEQCLNQDCLVCQFMNKLDRPTLVGLGLKRNQRLAAMLELAPSIARLLNSGETPEERRPSLVNALRELLGCSSTKLRSVANAGFLCMLCPRLKHLQLERGWGDVWSHLSKLGTAIGHHEDRQSQLAALVFLLRRCVRGEDQRWLWYLQPDDPEEQQRILAQVFAGCFSEQTAT